MQFTVSSRSMLYEVSCHASSICMLHIQLVTDALCLIVFRVHFRIAEIRWSMSSFAIYLWLALNLNVIAMVDVQLLVVYDGS
jgi:hypothetical protein